MLHIAREASEASNQEINRQTQANNYFIKTSFECKENKNRNDQTG